MVLASWWGPRPIAEALRLCDEVLAGDPSKRLEGQALIVRGATRALLGELEDGRREIATGRVLILDLGHLIAWAGLSAIEAEMELVVGDAARAYEVVAEGRDALMASAETGYLTTVVGYLAQVALVLGRDDETLRLADETRELAAADDFEPIARAQFVRAQVLARRGDFTGADELIASARELVDHTDWLMLRRELSCARAEVARLAGRPGEQREALEHALSLAEAKGNVAAADRDRAALASLGS
jgi:ATP/maltotriose-dependent transcriptional regulator MalT